MVKIGKLIKPHGINVVVLNMVAKKIFRSPIFWIFLLTIGLRFGLAIVNREANDNHIVIIKRLLDGLPVDRDNCVQCFHPKLYYYIVFQISKMLSISSESGLIILSQMTNVVVGILTLGFVWLHIKKQLLSDKLKYLLFLLVSVNPDFIGINAQGTNDSIVILFGAASICNLNKYVTFNKDVYMFLVTIFVILAGVSKGNGLVLFIGIGICLLIKLIIELINREKFIKTLKGMLLFVFSSVIFIFSFSPYATYLKKYKTLAAVSIPIQPLPGFFQESQYMRPGVTSVFSGYFTFRYFDLLKYPYSTNGWTDYPLHRTSLWSQLYARAFSVHFQDWPPSWMNTSTVSENVTRAILVLELLPLAFFLIGGYYIVVRVVASIRTKSEMFKMVNNENLYTLVITSLFVLFIIYYTLLYRDFSFMKPIFLYPALLCFINIFIRGMKFVNTIFKNNKTILHLGVVWVCLFAGLQVLDVLILIFQLS